MIIGCQKDELPLIPEEPEALLVIPAGFPEPEFPDDNAFTEARWELGKKLFFDPVMSRNSPGTYMVLDHVAIAQELGLPYVYLGYWVPGSRKMGYKANFSALEIFVRGTWMTLEDPNAFDAELHPLSTDPIAEQVAKISLPGSQPATD